MGNNGLKKPGAEPVPAFWSSGLRPFFLLGSVWAASAMTLWILTLAGRVDLLSRFDPVSWHAHAFSFGYLYAIIAGFLLTAVPNWTGRPPLVGWPLFGLVVLWVIGRGAVATSALWPVVLVTIVDLCFPIALGAFILREIILGGSSRNLSIVVMFALLTLGNLVFHLEAANGAYAAQGVGLRIALAVAVMMMTVIGGRIVPTFTRNWLKQTGRDVSLKEPMQAIDKVVLLATLVTLVTWVVFPHEPFSGIALLVMAGLQTARLVRWQGHYTTAEPLVLVLHAGYAFIPMGALTLGISLLWPERLEVAAAQHVWMAGAIGMMTLAVMTRASLGHTGHKLRASAGTVAIYATLVLSVLARIAAGVWPTPASLLYLISGLFWIMAFGGFALLYGGILLRPKL